MTGGISTKLRNLLNLPRDLFTAIHGVRATVERQQGALESEIRALLESEIRALLESELGALNEQLPDIADGLLRLLLQVRQLEEAISPAAIQPAPATPPIDAAALEAVVRAAVAAGLDSHDSGIARQLSALTDQTAQILQIEQDTHWLLPSNLWKPEVGDRVRQVLAVLRPFRIGNASKTRLGRPNDGGYVLIDDLTGIDSAISLGIDGDASWDLAIAQRGIPVHQFDHTVDGPPEAHALFEFHKTRIAPQDGEGCVSIATLLRERKAAGERRVVLKVDIEGDEWQCLADLDDATLQVCTQIVCEFHHLHRLSDPEFADLAQRCFSRLCASFFVCHVHANNCGDVYNVGNVVLPDTLEITFANRACYQPIDSLEIFPTSIDMPNQAGRADIFLGAFRFAA